LVEAQAKTKCAALLRDSPAPPGDTPVSKYPVDPSEATIPLDGFTVPTKVPVTKVRMSMAFAFWLFQMGKKILLCAEAQRPEVFSDVMNVLIAFRWVAVTELPLAVSTAAMYALASASSAASGLILP